jgi:hypothetical protein
MNQTKGAQEKKTIQIKGGLVYFSMQPEINTDNIPGFSRLLAGAAEEISAVSPAPAEDEDEDEDDEDEDEEEEVEAAPGVAIAA